MLKNEGPEIKFNGIAGTEKSIPEKIQENPATDGTAEEEPDKKHEGALSGDHSLINGLHGHPGDGYLDQEGHEGTSQPHDKEALVGKKYGGDPSDPALGSVRIDSSLRRPALTVRVTGFEWRLFRCPVRFVF